MLPKILAGIAVALILFLIVVATRPAAYHVERKLEVGAPADVVFGVVNDLRQFAGVYVLFGTPFEKLDPNMHKTFAGPGAGVGQYNEWSGKEAGKGKLTIDESVPGRRVRMKLEFVEPMESTATVALDLASAPTGSLVTWSMDGEHNFVGKAFAIFVDMDDMLGADIEQGLAQLKTVAESKQAALATATAPAGADATGAP